jgi:membrane-associated phospholipid phosphatase
VLFSIPKYFDILTPMKKLLIGFAVGVASLLAVGTFFDLPINMALYNPDSLFGKLFGKISLLPEFAIIVMTPAMAGTALYEMRRGLSRKTLALLVLIIALISLANFVKTIGEIKEATDLSFASSILILLVCYAAFFFAARPFAKKQPYEMLIVALIGLCAESFGYSIVTLIKIFWGRQRFYTMTDSAAQFTQWYLPQGKTSSGDFMSFPSGHSFSAMLAVWFAFFPRFIQKLKKWTPVIFTITILFGLCAMTSRIVYGRHFLSDVTVGAAIALALLALFRFLAQKYYHILENVIFKLR